MCVCAFNLDQHVWQKSLVTFVAFSIVASIIHYVPLQTPYMLSTRITLKVTASTMQRAMRLLAVTVFAAAGDGDKDATPPLHLEHLSLYVAPAQQKSRYVEPEAGQLEKSVTTLRELVEPHTDWCKVTYDKFKSKVQSVARCGNDAYDYFKNPRKDFYPRAGIIGLTGILGLVLARGSRIKKLMYPAGLMAVSASLYYPEQAVVIFKSTGDTVYERAVQTYAAVEKILKPASRTEENRDSETKPRGPQ